MTVFTDNRTIVSQLVKDFERRPYLPKHDREQIMYWEGQQSVITELKRRLQIRDQDGTP